MFFLHSFFLVGAERWNIMVIGSFNRLHEQLEVIGTLSLLFKLLSSIISKLSWQSSADDINFYFKTPNHWYNISIRVSLIMWASLGGRQFCFPFHIKSPFKDTHFATETYVISIVYTSSAFPFVCFYFLNWELAGFNTAHQTLIYFVVRLSKVNLR